MGFREVCDSCWDLFKKDRKSETSLEFMTHDFATIPQRECKYITTASLTVQDIMID